MNGSSGIIFDIQHFSTHDGPGVRSTVFFKGCPLRCPWCSNPESQKFEPELLFYQHLCAGCGECAKVCPTGAMNLDEQGKMLMDREKCVACGQCVTVCAYNARYLSGREADMNEISAEVRQHWRIFAHSGGGVTCGGGEALAQPAFLRALLENLHDNAGLHTCLDTTGYAPRATLEALLPFLDLILLDIKHMNGPEHLKATGVGNSLILENARALARLNFPVIVRLPLIPGFNDSEENLKATGAFMLDAGLKLIEIMPYHLFAGSKYAALGRVHTVYPGQPQGEKAARALRAYGLNVEVHER